MARDDKTPPNRTNDMDTEGSVSETVPGPTQADEFRQKDRGPMGPIGDDLGRPLGDDELPRRAEEIGLTEASRPGQGPTDDDLAPETLIREDGARHRFEPGGNTPADRDFKTVDAEEIGAGGGLDEAEEARLDPLDGKPWDGNPEDRLRPEPGINEESSEVARKAKKDQYGDG